MSRENFLYSFKRRASPAGSSCGASGPRSAAVRALLARPCSTCLVKQQDPPIHECGASPLFELIRCLAMQLSSSTQVEIKLCHLRRRLGASPTVSESGPLFGRELQVRTSRNQDLAAKQR